ncbi:hypothetical protein IHE61_27070 [Streptomyces sp. GKU 257-1]|nr:hypothetical protein [Streptomyces sp. GKU 257-1]
MERGNWWRFPPRAEPRLVGARQPAPAWQQSVDALPARIAGGCAVDRIPAGVLARPADATPPRLGDLCYAVPADPHGPTVLLGAPDAGEVPADSVLELLAALPEPVRRQVRLAPGGPRDILPTAQAVSDALGTELVVYTGMPLLAPGNTGGPASLRSVLVGADGAPRWQAFLDAVMCLPAEPNAPPRMPRPLRWSQFVANRTTVDRALAEHGVVRLSDRWRATVSRAGVYVSDITEAQPPAATRPTEADGPSIEVGRPGQVLEGTLPAALATLLAGLDPDVRGRARLLVHGTSQDGGRELRRTAAEHGLRSIRLQPSKPAPAAGRGAASANGPANGSARSAARAREARGAVQPGGRPQPPMPQTPPDRPVPAASSTAAARPRRRTRRGRRHRSSALRPASGQGGAPPRHPPRALPTPNGVLPPRRGRPPQR